MAILASSAWWFLPFILPICFYVTFTDMREMRITNQAVLALAAVFVVVGLIAIPTWEAYFWRIAQMLIMLVLGIVLNAAGAMGAGDSKFIAAAAPYVALGDLRMVMALLAATTLAAYVTHRGIKFSPLRRIAPHWQSWQEKKKFPMGFALASALMMYLALGARYGA